MTYVGFTGSRQGMTSEQARAFHALMLDLKPAALIHGDCVGADAQAHQYALVTNLKICVHPPAESALRAFCKDAHWVGLPRSYYARNRAIVEACDVLIACPSSIVQHGGTWSTIKIAARLKKPVFVVYPDGSVLMPWKS